MADFYRSSFGDLPLWISRIYTDKSRSQVIHELSAGDDYVVQDRGQAPLKSRVTILFDWMNGDDLAPLDRLRKFTALVDDKPRLFTHPVEGTFPARVGSWNYDVDSNGVISGEAELIRVGDVVAVSPAGAGSLPAAGGGAVAAAADALDIELEGIGQPSVLPAQAAAAVDGWAAQGTPNPRDVLAQTGSLTEQLGTQAAGFEADLSDWAAFKSTILLAEAVRAAAESATADTASTFVVKIGSTIALRALVASIYGADEADRRYEQAMQLNDIANPAWIEPGTELVLPQSPPPPRTA